MRLTDCTVLLRSKNAGPYHLTFDVFFRDAESARLFIDVWRRKPETLAAACGVDPSSVAIEELPQLCAAKITVPRVHDAGSILDLDVLGCQQVGILMELEL